MTDLIDSFIAEKIDNYIQPTRAGTPRGQKIGFMLPKYKAAVYSLKKLSGLDHSKLAGVSHAVFRKWKGQPDFKALVSELESNFFSNL
tara:strand:+ start:417 stop:680 length:264 start_codon:yes stop_codon:yes gene_type:complete